MSLLPFTTFTARLVQRLSTQIIANMGRGKGVSSSSLFPKRNLPGLKLSSSFPPSQKRNPRSSDRPRTNLSQAAHRDRKDLAGGPSSLNATFEGEGGASIEQTNEQREKDRKAWLESKKINKNFEEYYRVSVVIWLEGRIGRFGIMLVRAGKRTVGRGG